MQGVRAEGGGGGHWGRGLLNDGRHDVISHYMMADMMGTINCMLLALQGDAPSASGKRAGPEAGGEEEEEEEDEIKTGRQKRSKVGEVEGGPGEEALCMSWRVCLYVRMYVCARVCLDLCFLHLRDLGDEGMYHAAPASVVAALQLCA